MKIAEVLDAMPAKSYAENQEANLWLRRNCPDESGWSVCYADANHELREYATRLLDEAYSKGVKRVKRHLLVLSLAAIVREIDRRWVPA